MENSHKPDRHYYRELKKFYAFKDIPIQEWRQNTGAQQGFAEGDLPTHVFGMSVITITQDHANLYGVIKPQWVDDMTLEWERELISQHIASNQARFTQNTISQHITLDRHRIREVGVILLCGAVWLSVTNDRRGDEFERLLKQGNVHLHYQILKKDNRCEFYEHKIQIICHKYSSYFQ